jgi:hypothetical protein
MLGYLAKPIIEIWQFPQIVANLGPLLHEKSFVHVEIKLFRKITGYVVEYIIKIWQFGKISLDIRPFFFHEKSFV